MLYETPVNMPYLSASWKWSRVVITTSRRCWWRVIYSILLIILMFLQLRDITINNDCNARMKLLQVECLMNVLITFVWWTDVIHKWRSMYNNSAARFFGELPSCRCSLSHLIGYACDVIIGMMRQRVKVNSSEIPSVTFCRALFRIELTGIKIILKSNKRYDISEILAVFRSSRNLSRNFFMYIHSLYM